MSSSGPTSESTKNKFKLAFHQELQAVYLKHKKDEEDGPNINSSNNNNNNNNLTPPPLQSADVQKVQRSFTAFTKEAKSLFSLVNKTIALVKETEACYLQVSKQLKSMYESGESILAKNVERLYAVMDDDDKNGVALMEDFELEWSNAEEWFRRSTKSLKGAKPEELAYFMEQRFDGLDKAVLAFLMLAQKTLGPKALPERERINSSLDGLMRINEVCPTVRDSGVSATMGSAAESILAQCLPAHYMRMYLATLLTEENVEFCMNVHVLESLHNQDPNALDTRQKAREIVERYISDKSESQINISDAMKKKVIEASKVEPIAIGPFKDAYAEILRLMHTANSPSLFKQTPFYGKLIRRLTPRPYSPTFSLGESKTSFYAALPRPFDTVKNDKKSEKRANVPKNDESASGSGSLVTVDGVVPSITVLAPPPPPPQSSSPSSVKRPEPSTPRRKRAETIRKTLRQQSSHSFMTLKKKDIPNGRFITISDVLRNKPLYKDFKSFLREKGDEKPLQFVKEVSTFSKKHFPSQLEIRADATQIFEQFLVFSDIEPSIGTSFETQQDLYTQIYETPDKPLRNDMFSRASKEVTEVMKLTVFIQYLISERWLSVKWTPHEDLKARKLSHGLRLPSSVSSSIPTASPGSEPAVPVISQQRLLNRPLAESSKLSSQSTVILQQDSQLVPPPPRMAAPSPPLELISRERATSPEPKKVVRRHTRNASEASALGMLGGKAAMNSSSGGGSSQEEVAKAPRGFTQDPPAPSPPEHVEMPPPPVDPEKNTCTELLENYRHIFLPKYETLVKALSGLKVFDDLAMQRNNVRIIQAIARCVNKVELPQGLVVPQFTVVNDNPKFVQFRKKLLKCTWETSQKVSFIIKDLAANKDNMAGFSVKYAEYTDIYHNVLLAFSTTE